CVGRRSGRSRVAAALAGALVTAMNARPLLPAMRGARGPDTARNFLEHDDAPMFFPIREALTRGEAAGVVHPGNEVHVLYNAKRIFPLFYLGPLEDQYPDLAKRYHLRSMSFRDDFTRCRCSAGATTLAVFVAFPNLGANRPD